MFSILQDLKIAVLKKSDADDSSEREVSYQCKSVAVFGTVAED